MSNKTQKHLPQNYEEMKTEMLTTKPKSKIYKVEADEHRSDVLSALIDERISELAENTKREKISLSDLKAVQEQTLLYMRACAETGSIPSFMGLCRSLGYSRRAIYDCIDRRTYPKTSDWLEMARDTFSDILAESALTNNVNATFAIFCQKAQYLWRESVEIVATANNSPVLGDVVPQEEIEKKYLESIVFDLAEEETI